MSPNSVRMVKGCGGRGRNTNLLKIKKRVTESVQLIFSLWLVFYSNKAVQEI